MEEEDKKPPLETLTEILPEHGRERRRFFKKLAKKAAYVAPLVVTLKHRPAFADSVGVAMVFPPNM